MSLPETTEHPTQRPFLSPGTLFLMVGLIAVIVVIGLQLLRDTMEPPTSGPAPDFTLQLYDGGRFTLSEHRGSYVVINFWGSWCGPCRDEVPELQEAWEMFRDHGVVVVGVGFRDIERAAREFIAEMGLTYLNGNDDGLHITELYNISGAPQTFIVDRQGNVVAFMIGPFQRGWLAETLRDLMSGEEPSL